MLLKIFYVFGELALSEMSGSKYSCQRNTYSCSSSIYLYKRKKGVSNDTNTKERMVSVPTDKLIIPRIFGFVSPFFENFYFIFLMIVKRLSSDCLFNFLLSVNISWMSLGYSTSSSKNS